jgi:hypothetical protein
MHPLHPLPKPMKTLSKHVGAVVVGAFLALVPGALSAQTSTTTTITSTGTVSDWKPNAVAVKVNTSPEPVSYSFTRTTTYVDQFGNPISSETIRAGTPVTVYYEQQGDALVANRVVVNRTVTTTDAVPPPPIPPPPIVTTAPPVTTTTTVNEPPGSPAVNGVITDADDGHVDLRTADSLKPIHYKAHDSTAYVDENGNPVPRKFAAKGTPATVFYEQHGDDLFATRVVLKSPSILDR